MRWLPLLAVVVLPAAFAVGCGAAAPGPEKTAPGGTTDERLWPEDDGSLCQRFVHWKNNPALEASETAGPGAYRPNIRRVFKVVGEHDNRHSVLVCREIDTNLDGLKDVVRTFTEKGDALHEESDTNFDGKIDVWLNFADGRIEEEDLDTTFATGRPNVWKFYTDGVLTRIKRNTHCVSGKPDVWEIYYGDRLERVGNDNTCDGHVDRWDRDAQLLAAEDAAQEKAAAQADAGATTEPPAPALGIASDAGLASAAPGKSAKNKK
jgi:hypothetical protein